VLFELSGEARGPRDDYWTVSMTRGEGCRRAAASWKAERETGDNAPGATHNVEFIYRLATDTWQGVRVGYCLH